MLKQQCKINSFFNCIFYISHSDVIFDEDDSIDIDFIELIFDSEGK